MRKEGFNIRATKLDGSNFVQVENSGQGGAGVAASWVGSFSTKGSPSKERCAVCKSQVLFS